jgi:uncharacterized protein YkwD
VSGLRPRSGALLPAWEKMAFKMRKSIRFTLLWAAALAALLVAGGCGQYQGQTYQVKQYQARPYPPSASGGSGAWVPGPAASRASAPLQDVAARIWRLTNEIRGKYGIPPLAQDARLAAVAQAYCDDMLRRRFFSHTDPEGRTAKDRLLPSYPRPIYRLGENIWTGTNLSTGNRGALARFIINSWMKSPGHRENLLAPDFTHLGVGVAARGREIRAAQIFISLQQR